VLHKYDKKSSDIQTSCYKNLASNALQNFFINFRFKKRLFLSPENLEIVDLSPLPTS